MEIVMLLPGRQAARVRRQAAELLVRFLGGDIALVDEVCRNHGFQEELAVRAPEKGIDSNFHGRERENAKFEGRLRSRTLFFSSGTQKNIKLDDC